MSGLERYQKVNKIGEGTYGVVYKAIDKVNGKFVALKKVRLGFGEEGVPSTAIREIAVMRELCHPNIERLIDVIHTGKMIFLIFEFVQFDLKRFLDIQVKEKEAAFLDPRLIKSFMYQLLKGIGYCHAHCIIHRDLKPQNILIDHMGNLKIGDFGLARTFSVPLRPYSHEIVTLWYRAPEILLGCAKYSASVDIWSVGCIMAELALGKPIFCGDSEIDELYKIFQVLGTPTEDVWHGVGLLPYWKSTFPKWKRKTFEDLVPALGEDGLELLERLLQYDPTKRPSALDALNMRYFEKLRAEEEEDED
ncbi:putative Cell division control protein [Monocercomonoides exilis]|uniref:putative Cell division control protein n=1 Tax=Monocercomonoides exilis TaxID=2049356 RepID=UPI00355A9502|nr:putative Cell division control protein [Monocercomonoides exilis]|eukprot:MONOS_4184.1-p1 / transcript=MONOS_4184.1 / gene=MONOS_4184 / organism=Monocercomonoides_exilis_PA203 / gene_product=Cell division control protein / transcript_product=Cell division control protein / location=Mono_scaffold00107:102222-103453(+) / protein_length=305 / sequence_SO=supercontig / SO=protein_coding / is_pseudo=false